MKAMILAAGLGTRLKPLTNTVSKPMVPMVGRPCMEHIIFLLKKHGITDIIANIHYLPEQIKYHFQDGRDWGVNMHYSLEEDLLGTAGGLKKVQNFFGQEPVLVISGDALTDINLAEFYKFHKARGGLATLALKKVSDPTQYGVVIKNNDHSIKAFQEKPQKEEAISNLANTGIYLFKPEIFNYIPAETFFDYAKDVFPKLLENNITMMGYETKDYWCDVGNLDIYREAHYDMLMGVVKVDIPAKNYNGCTHVGENTRVHPDTVIKGPVYIGDDCIIEKGARLFGPVSIGPESVIKAGATVKRSVLWNAVEVGENSFLSDAIIGAGCTVPAEEYLEKDIWESKMIYDFRETAAGK